MEGRRRGTPRGGNLSNQNIKFMDQHYDSLKSKVVDALSDKSDFSFWLEVRGKDGEVKHCRWKADDRHPMPDLKSEIDEDSLAQLEYGE